MNVARRALWFVETHAREAHALEAVAAACHVSPYHLTRAFAAATGWPLMRYVRARRLTEAARRLAGGADDILALAFDAGYGSHAAFTRAFRDHFACTPAQLRARGHVDTLPLTEPLHMPDAPAVPIAPPRFETSDAMLLAGIAAHYTCHDGNAIAQQWQRLAPHLGHVPGQVGRVAYGAVYNFDADNTTYDYLAAVPVRDGRDLPAGFATLAVPSRRVAVFTHAGHVAGIAGTFSAIWSEWFPTSGVTPADGPTLERYGERFDPRTGLGGVEIWIPVEG